MKNRLIAYGEYLAVALLTVASTIFLATRVLTNANLLPDAASTQAGPIDKLFGIHWWLISFFFSLITVFILYSIARSLAVHGRNPRGAGFGDYFEGNQRLEVVWTVVPLGIVLYLAFIGAGTLGEIERRYPGPVEVNVIGQQWSWRFEYPTEEGFPIVSDVLYLPVDQPVVLHLTSSDVIHSFWVPEFRIKQDALPGGEAFIRDIRITPSELGEYKLQCAELCGAQHWSMLSDVKVVSQVAFDSWMLEASKGCEDTDENCGLRWATQYGCLSCHAVAEGPSAPTIGPSWVGIFGNEESLADGTQVLVDEDYLLQSILDPNAQVVAGFQAGQMPQNFSEVISEEQLAQIVAFIRSLGE